MLHVGGDSSSGCAPGSSSTSSCTASTNAAAALCAEVLYSKLVLDFGSDTAVYNLKEMMRLLRVVQAASELVLSKVQCLTCVTWVQST